MYSKGRLVYGFMLLLLFAAVVPLRPTPLCSASGPWIPPTAAIQRRYQDKTGVGEDASRPVLWYENSQLMGDSITIYLEDGQIKNLVVNNNSFMLSQNKLFDKRFDQTSSDGIDLYFIENRLKRAEFSGKVQSIYFMYDDELPNGVVKSTAHSAVIVFKDNEIEQVRLFGSPTSEYHPGVKVEGLERTFTLPKFVLKEKRPLKKDFLMNQQEEDE